MTNNPNPAIVVIAYNRPHSLKRLLSSLEKSIYHSTDIPLVISIDFQDSEKHNEVVLIAAEFEWKHGDKQVITHTSNLGLRKHILQCGGFTRQYGSIIMLEDDLQVSPFFYNYASKALSFYSIDTRIAGISLYNHKRNFCNELPFDLLGEAGADVYFLQLASSWGQAWTAAQWQRFQTWYANNPRFTPTDKIPTNIANWPESSWLKYFTKYVIESGSYFVYPKISYSTNFGDRGTHNPDSDHTYQVPLCIQESGEYHFTSIEKSINVYDSFFELDANVLKKLSPSLPDNLVVDLYGMKNLDLYNAHFALSSKKLKTKHFQKSYGLFTKPLPMNIIDETSGSEIHLAATADFENEQAGIETEYKIWQYIVGKVKAKILLKRIQEKLEQKFLGNIRL